MQDARSRYRGDCIPLVTTTANADESAWRRRHLFLLNDAFFIDGVVLVAPGSYGFVYAYEY